MGLEDLILPFAEIAAAGLAVGVGAWLYYTRFYLPVPPNRALVLFGHRAGAPRGEPGRRSAPSDPEVRPPKIVVGGGVFVAPWNKGVSHLSLGPVDVDLTVRSMHALDGGRASGWEARIQAQAKIPTDPALLLAAAENLLEKSEDELRSIVRHAVEGVVPAVLAQWRPAGGEPDWERLAAEIQAAVAPELVTLGLTVRTLSITELRSLSPASPVTPSVGVVAVKAAASGAEFPSTSPHFARLDERLSRAERSLGIMGTEVVRLVREAQASVFDVPLGAADSGEGTEGPGEPTHDSMGGERSLPTRRAAVSAAGGEGEPALRPPSDNEP